MRRYACRQTQALADLRPLAVSHRPFCAPRYWRRYSDSSRASPHDSLIYPEASTTNHHDLPSFLSYSERTGLDRASTVFVGTHYEYTVAASLARYGFYLKRVGGAGDFGTDLLGTWTLPADPVASSPSSSSSSSSSTQPRHLRVLMQCKAGAAQKTGPQHIRELEGALAAAPPGWRGRGTLAMLVSQKPATKGVRDAVGRSKWPMGFVACSKEGRVVQMLWNRGAEEGGLQGVGVTVRNDTSAAAAEGDKTPELVLQIHGRSLPLLSG